MSENRKDNKSKEEIYRGMNLRDACGFMGPAFIGMGIYLIVTGRMNYQSWDEYFNDENIVSTAWRYFPVIAIFVGLIGIAMKNFGKKHD